jgi:hypothetical protein
MPSPDAEGLLRGIRAFASEVSHWAYPRNVLARVTQEDARATYRSLRERIRDTVLNQLRRAADLARQERIDEADAVYAGASFTWTRWEEQVARMGTDDRATAEAASFVGRAESALESFGSGVATLARGAASSAFSSAAPFIALAVLAAVAMQRRRARV